jgi:hypothetical protein
MEPAAPAKILDPPEGGTPNATVNRSKSHNGGREARKSAGGVVYWQVRKPALLPDEGHMGNAGYEKKDEKIESAIRVDEYWYGVSCRDLPCGSGLAPMAGG